MDASDALVDALRDVAVFVPKLLLAIVIVVVGWLVAKLLRKLVDKALERVGFDRWVERGGVGRVLQRSKYDASDLVALLVYYGVLLLALQMAFGVFGPNPVSALLSSVVAWIPRAVVAIVIIVVAAAIANAVRELISGALGGLGYGRILANIASVFILGLGIIAALNQIGVATTVTMPVLIAVLATVAGVLIVGVGGGLVRPMQSRWERILDRGERETPEVRERAATYARTRQEARDREAREREARDREMREREARDREMREREARDREAREREARDREARARQAASEATQQTYVTPPASGPPAGGSYPSEPAPYGDYPPPNQPGYPPHDEAPQRGPGYGDPGYPPGANPGHPPSGDPGYPSGEPYPHGDAPGARPAYPDDDDPRR